MTLNLRAWKDAGLQVRLYISTSGDFVQLGNRIDFPFNAGGPSGVPFGWTPYGTNYATDVNFSVGFGRFNISGKLAVPVYNRTYGASISFPLKEGYRYLVSAQVQTMQDKSYGTRYIMFVADPGNSTRFANSRTSQSSWENITVGTAFLNGFTTGTITLIGYYPSTQTDPNWGIQWQNLSVLEQAPNYPPPTWQEITCDTRSVQTRYGRDKFTSRYDVGNFTLGVANKDGEFTYDDDPATSWGLRPGRFIRGTVGNGSAETPLFYGVIDSLSDDYSLDGRVITVINCLDISQLLSNTTVPTSTGNTNYKSGDRIGILYRAVGWHPDYEDTPSGIFLQQPIYANGRTVRDEIGLGADSEGSYWFAERNGVLKYYDRDWPTKAPTQTAVQAEILAMPEPTQLPVLDPFPTSPTAPWVCAHQLDVDWSRDRIINFLTLANQGGSAVTFEDDESQKKYGVQTYQRTDFLNINDTPEYLQTRANDIMSGFSDAVLRVKSVQFRPTKESYDWASTVFLNDVVRVWYVHPSNLWGYAVVTHVQSVQHSFLPDDWVMTLSLDQPIYFNRFEWDPYMGIHGWDLGEWDVNLWDQGSEEAGALWDRDYRWTTSTSVWGK